MGSPTSPPQYRDQVRVLAVAAEKRSPVLPDAPTFKELGYDLVEGAYRGVSAPPGTPNEIVKALADAFDKVNRNPEFVKKMQEMAFDLEFMGPEEYQKFVADRQVYYAKLLKDVGAIK